MEFQSRRFARWVLTIHALLLVLVAGIVIAAARDVQLSARQQAVQQAINTQQLLAKQTARGLVNYYRAISSVVELLKPTQEEEEAMSSGALPPPLPPTTGRFFGGPGRGALLNRLGDTPGMRRRFMDAVWQDVDERVSMLFVLDQSTPPPVPNRDAEAARNAPTQPAAIHDAYNADQSLTPEQIVEHLRPWLAGVTGPSLSRFQQIGNVRFSAIAVPMRGPMRRLLVAVVPIDRIEHSLLGAVDLKNASYAVLVDQDGTIMSTPHTDLIGKNAATSARDPAMRDMTAKYLESGSGGTSVFEKPRRFADETLPPAIVTFEPVVLSQFNGTRWCLIMSSGLEQVSVIVNRIFKEAVFWAAFVILSVSAILVSTSLQLIRGRVRLERMRHELAERELSQARQIQLNWLPQSAHDTEHLTVAAVNRPAYRISGDFYNWFDLPDGRTAVVIGDVTGHGMAAAFLMSTAQLLLRGALLRLGDPGKALRDVNRQLCTQAFHGQFVTVFLMVIDPQQAVADVATAGHPMPLIGEGRSFEAMQIEPQLMLGVDVEEEYEARQIKLPGGAGILLYTDGVVDAINPSGKRYRLDGLLGALGGPYADADAILTAVTSRVDAFRHGADLADDLTLVAVQLRGEPVTGFHGGRASGTARGAAV